MAEATANWRNKPVCFLGGGVLGRRTAACFVAAGHHVIVRDPSQEARAAAEEYIHHNISTFTALSYHDPGTWESTESLSTAVKDCWLVIEAVPEILKLKENTFQELEQSTPDDCILASNSSSYKTGEFIAKIGDQIKTRVLNMHFMMPPEASTPFQVKVMKSDLYRLSSLN